MALGPDEGAAVDLTQIVVPALVAAGFGGLAGAIYSNWHQGRRSKEQAQRITAAMLADVQRVRRISQHNADTAVHGGPSPPRAFIRLPTQTYELLLFSGQTAVLKGPTVLESIMEYLTQAHHVNSMVDMVQGLLLQGARTRNIAGGEIQSYMQAIREYSSGGSHPRWMHSRRS